LMQPVYLRKATAEEEVWKSIWSATKQVQSKVDAKKLRKAEEKLKLKAQRRDDIVDPSTTTITSVEASASQSLSKKSVKLENAGVNKTKDVKIENFDISFGSNILL